MVYPVTNPAVPTGTRSTENSLATRKVLDMLARGRASIFPGKMERGTQWHKPSVLVVTGTYSKDDRQVVAYAFLKFFPDFLGI